MKKEITPSSLFEQVECQSRLAECCVGRLLTQRDTPKCINTWGGKQCPNRMNASLVEQSTVPHGICFRPALTTTPSISSILTPSKIRCWSPKGLHEETYVVNAPELHLARSKGERARERLDKGNQWEGQGENARNTAPWFVSLLSRCPCLNYWSTSCTMCALPVANMLYSRKSMKIGARVAGVHVALLVSLYPFWLATMFPSEQTSSVTGKIVTSSHRKCIITCVVIIKDNT